MATKCEQVDSDKEKKGEKNLLDLYIMFLLQFNRPNVDPTADTDDWES